LPELEKFIAELEADGGDLDLDAVNSFEKRLRSIRYKFLIHSGNGIPFARDESEASEFLTNAKKLSIYSWSQLGLVSVDISDKETLDEIAKIYESTEFVKGESLSEEGYWYSWFPYTLDINIEIDSQAFISVGYGELLCGYGQVYREIRKDDDSLYFTSFIDELLREHGVKYDLEEESEREAVPQE
jgi:hypothetical protein